MSGIQPQPMPTGYEISQVPMANGEHHLLIKFVRPSGMDFMFMPPDFALDFAAQIEREARQAKTGLTVVQGARARTITE